MTKPDDKLGELIAEYRAAKEACPYAKPRTPPVDKDCSICGASSNEACRKRTLAAFAIADAALNRELPEP